jgi:uncharacterized protein YbjT (DUF2867 family)
MILITGSAGKTGRSVLQLLAGRDVPVRALVRRSEQIPLVKHLGAQDVISGDMRSQKVMLEAVEGIEAIYHIPPNMSPDEISIGQNVIRAAQSAGVKHLVFHSVLKPQIEAMPHHWNKMLVEELLIASQLPYTILQPSAYMQNILANWDQILEEGIYPVPYPADTRLSLVDLRDIAEVAAIVLSEAEHKFAIYELVGTPSLSQTEVADILEQVLERKVRVTSIPIDQWAKQARDAGLAEYQVETLVKMFTYYEEFGFDGNSNVLSWLLGRAPGSLQDFILRSKEDKQLMNRISVN